MFTGTEHAGGPTPGSMSFEKFVNSLLPQYAKATPRAWSIKDAHEHNRTDVTVSGNEHFLPQLFMCNFGKPSVSPDAPTWDVVATSGANQSDTYERVSAFIRRVFGSRTYERVARSGWCTCGSWWAPGGHATCVDRPFFAPHAEKGASNLHNIDMTDAAAAERIRARVRELYADDVTYYEWSKALREADGSAPDDAGCL